MKNKSFFAFCLLLLSSLQQLSPLRAQTDIFMKVQPNAFRPLQLVIKNIICPTRPELADQLRRLFVADLNYSAYIQVTENGNFPGGSSENDLETADLTADGKIEIESLRLTFDLTIKDRLTDFTVFHKTYTDNLNALRNLSHTVADEVVYRLSGEWGIASTKIAFITEIGDAKELVVMDYDGWNPTVLTRQKSLCLSPGWSPEGKKLIFSLYRLSTDIGSELAIYNFKDNQISRLPRFKGSTSSPIFSPDGEKIAFTVTYQGNPDIYVADSDGKNVRRLTNSPAIDTAPCWSPNGKLIAFTSDRSGSPQVYIMDADGTNVRRLTYNNNYNASPDWSPKGDAIAYVSQENHGFQIYLIKPDGENARCITDGNASYENPSWSPNGQHLVCASNRSGKWDIYSMFADGSHLRRLTTSGKNTMPVWSPRFKGNR